MSQRSKPLQSVIGIEPLRDKAFLRLLPVIFLWVAGTGLLPTDAQAGHPIALQLGRQAGEGSDSWQTLRQWTMEEAKAIGPAKSLFEPWPKQIAAPWKGLEKKTEWRGVLLGDLIQKSMESLSADDRAQVDLIILHSSGADGGARALIPRALLTKFPLLLAWAREGKNTESWVLIPPKTSRPKIQTENVPLDSYFLRGVEKIELASSRVRFRSALLSRRTDPIAMRGEKLFLSSCLGCHESGRAPAFTSVQRDRLGQWSSREFAPAHSRVGGVPPVNDRDWNSLRSYWEAVRTEAIEAATPRGERGAKGTSFLHGPGNPSG